MANWDNLHVQIPGNSTQIVSTSPITNSFEKHKKVLTFEPHNIYDHSFCILRVEVLLISKNVLTFEPVDENR